MVLLTARRPWLASIATFQIVLLLAFCSCGVAHSDDNDQEEFCPIEATVDLTNAEEHNSGFLTDGYFFPGDSTKLIAGTRRGCICDLRPCLFVCPPKNMTRNGNTQYVKHSAIPSVYTTNLTLDDEGGRVSPDERFLIFVWNPCGRMKRYSLDPEKHEGDEFYLLKNGSMFLPRMNESNTRFFDSRSYCLKAKKKVYTPMVCSRKVTDEYRIVKYVAALAAVPFIIATVVVYSVLPKLRNIHGKTLRCYLCCLIVTYVTLAADRIPASELSPGVLCLCLGFTIYFFFLASFFWLNVMCFDMWWRLGDFGTLRSSGKQHDCKKFITYSIYVWGTTIVLTTICVIMEFSPGIPESIIRPGFRRGLCWFEGKSAQAVYFFGPLSVTLVCNICLFISTSMKLIKHKKDTNSEFKRGGSKRHDNNKRWFNLHLKLFIVMGISWSTEVISWLWTDPEYLWRVTDLVNGIQGFLIFLIFVCKRNIWFSLKERYGKKKEPLPDPQNCNSTSENSFFEIDGRNKFVLASFKDGSRITREQTTYVNYPKVF